MQPSSPTILTLFTHPEGRFCPAHPPHAACVFSVVWLDLPEAHSAGLPHGSLLPLPLPPHKGTMSFCFGRLLHGACSHENMGRLPHRCGNCTREAHDRPSHWLHSKAVESMGPRRQKAAPSPEYKLGWGKQLLFPETYFPSPSPCIQLPLCAGKSHAIPPMDQKTLGGWIPPIPY